MDRRASREELAILGEIAGEAAHELRNALAVIAGSASLLKSAPALGPPFADHVVKIERNVRLAQNVLDALMSLARGEAVRGEAVALTSAIAEARKEAGGALAYKDDVAPSITVRGSEVLLSRMFRVIYENAFQAGAHAVETRAWRDSEYVVVEIGDDGHGIPEAVRATLFEPLVTTKKEGTGLGLALARRVARAHGGDLELAPHAEGGARFRIALRA